MLALLLDGCGFDYVSWWRFYASNLFLQIDNNNYRFGRRHEYRCNEHGCDELDGYTVPSLWTRWYQHTTKEDGLCFMGLVLWTVLDDLHPMADSTA